MKLSYLLLGGASALLLTACDPSTGTGTDGPDAATPPAETAVPDAADPAGTTETSAPADKLAGAADATYSLEKSHAFLSATFMHNGLSEYTLDFTDFDATLDFMASDPASSTLSATVQPRVNVKYPANYKAGHPDSEYENWPDALSKDTRFIGGSEYPDITFVSTEVSKTGDYSGTVTGDLTFLGVTNPVTLDVTYNGVGNTSWYGERDVIGFDAETTISRSAFGQESLEGVISDDVVIKFSGEFLQDETEAAEPAE